MYKPSMMEVKKYSKFFVVWLFFIIVLGLFADPGSEPSELEANLGAIGLGIFSIAFFILSYNYPDIKYRRLISDGKPLSQGLNDDSPVYFEGKVKAIEGTMKSPIEELDSVLFKYEVNRFRHLGGGEGRTWRLLSQGTESKKFAVENRSGKQVLINPESVELNTSAKKEVTIASNEETPDSIKNLIREDEELWSKDNSTLLSGKRRYKERKIKPGDQIFVLGKAEPKVENNYNLPLLEQNNDTPLLIGEGTKQEVLERLINPLKVYLIYGTIVASYALTLFSLGII